MRGSSKRRTTAAVPSLDPSSTIDQLEIADGLREHTVDRLGDVPGVVVRRHRDGDEWRAGHHGVLTAAMPPAAIPSAANDRIIRPMAAACSGATPAWSGRHST